MTVTTPNDRDVVLTREFDAPRDLVFEALTVPALLERWYGPEGCALVVCEIDLRLGGAWRFVMRKPNGREIGQRGVYREIARPARIVHTESWEDWDAGETLVTTELVERRGRTTCTVTMRFASPEVRQALLEAGLANGADTHYGKLDELLAVELSSRLRR